MSHHNTLTRVIRSLRKLTFFQYQQQGGQQGYGQYNPYGQQGNPYGQQANPYGQQGNPYADQGNPYGNQPQAQPSYGGRPQPQPQGSSYYARDEEQGGGGGHGKQIKTQNTDYILISEQKWLI
jgi:hypothetical protein